ncbi:MAG: hypothetical protein ACRET7_12200 [Burkholderiales bacterium]
MEKHWLVRPTTIRLLWRVFFVVLAVTVVAQFAVPVQTHFGLDGSFAFNAWYGFAVCAAMIVLAKLLGAWLKRSDAYYDE